MVKVNWLDSYNLGIAGIDDQHQLLVGLINDLAVAMGEGKSRELLAETIEGMTAYSVYHFSIEEKLLAQNGYPGLAGHQGQHRTFIEKLQEFKADFESGSLTVSLDMLSFLTEWLIRHICKSDRHYAAFLEEKGGGSSRVA